MGDCFGRFGFNFENGDLESVIYRLKKINNIKISGLHFHNSTKTKSLNIFKHISAFAVHIGKFFNLDLNYIDIGGSFFGDKPNAPTYFDYAKTITNELKQYYSPQKTTLIIEPGVAIAASCFNYLTKVIDVRKRKHYKVVTTDGSIMHIDPQMKGRKFKNKLISKSNECSEKQVIAGYTCMEKDIYAELINQKKLYVNDKILFYNAGAYTLSFIPLFIEYFPNVYLHNNEIFSLVRKKWTVKEYIQKSIIE